jgi:hypothetical protein
MNWTARWPSATAVRRCAPPAANSLRRQDPAAAEASARDYDDYSNLVDDLRNATDLLLYLIEQRREAEIGEQAVEVARRYNALSRRFGPGDIALWRGREPAPRPGIAAYRDQVPGSARQ